MKKIFTLMTFLMLAVASWAAVGDKYEIILNGSNVVKLNGADIEAADFLTWNSGKHNFNAKFTGCTYAGISFTKGLKMEGATLLQWTATAEAKVVIVRSNYNDSKTLLFDEATLESPETIDGGMVYTLEGVQPGTHKVTRGDGETGVFYISIEYTGEAKTQLDAPAISFDKANGQVTISAVKSAKEVRYTTDGTNPSAEAGEVYAAPFTVEDGTTVKAIAIGEGNFINSAVTSQLVLIDGVVVKAPAIKQLNGTVYIKSETIGSSVEYSLDQQNWKNGDRAFTLTETATVYARATREGCTASEVASAEVKVRKAPTNTEKIYIFYDNPENYKIWGYCNENSMEGQDSYYGYELAISGNAEKNWSNGFEMIIPGIQVPKMTFAGDTVTTLKVSNGAQNTITLPKGKKAVRLTFYSYVNAAAAAASVTGWKEVNGVEYEYAEVPMCCFSDLERTVEIPDSIDATTGKPATKQVRDMAGNPDIRVFDLDFVEEAITFTNKGTQICFAAVLEIATDSTEVDPAGIAEVKKVAAMKGETYNLAGQKVSDSYKGLVIRNGKKILK